MHIRLSNVWENITDIIEWTADEDIRRKYKTNVFTSDWKLKISELDFIREILMDFSQTVTFRFLFDYNGQQKKEIISLIELDIDLVINKLMVDLSQTKNSAGVVFQGSDKVADVERYRDLDDRLMMMDTDSKIALEIAWLQEWISAKNADTDEPDQASLDRIYAKFLRITGYMNEFEMVSPDILLSELLQSEQSSLAYMDAPHPPQNDPTRHRGKPTQIGKSDSDYSELAAKIPSVVGDTNEMIFWLMEFTGEYRTATGKIGNIVALDNIFTTFYIESGLIDTMPDMDAFGLLKSLENNS